MNIYYWSGNKYFDIAVSCQPSAISLKEKLASKKNCSAFQIDELHPHNQNLVGALHNKNAFYVAFALRPALWSTDIKTAVKVQHRKDDQLNLVIYYFHGYCCAPLRNKSA